jgi:choline dehydrogenase-like flavoprotein
LQDQGFSLAGIAALVERWERGGDLSDLFDAEDQIGSLLGHRQEAVLTAEELEIRPYTAGFGAMVSGRRDDPGDHPHIGVALMRPESRGIVTLASADPDVSPIIEHHYDASPADVAKLAAGAELARELVGATAQMGAVSWSTSQHLARTAPMGVGAEAVVDAQCRVHGVDNLWVVDGSVLPTITSRGPHATIVMIGHRAAEFISPA